jgi:hypothetical protein
MPFFLGYSCLFEYSTEVCITIVNDNIFDGCFCGGSEGVNAGSVLRSKLIEELNPSPQWARTCTPHIGGSSSQYLHGS